MARHGSEWRATSYGHDTIRGLRLQSPVVKLATVVRSIALTKGTQKEREGHISLALVAEKRSASRVIDFD